MTLPFKRPTDAADKDITFNGGTVSLQDASDSTHEFWLGNGNQCWKYCFVARSLSWTGQHASLCVGCSLYRNHVPAKTSFDLARWIGSNSYMFKYALLRWSCARLHISSGVSGADKRLCFSFVV